MNKDRIFVIAITTLLIIGTILLCISMFGEERNDTHLLSLAMSCICVANVLVVYRNGKKAKKNKNCK